MRQLPDTDDLPRVAFAYDVGGKPVICVHDGHHLHGKGVCLEFDDGARVLVGHMCAKNIWGVDFQGEWRAFERAENEAHYLRRRNAARAAGPLMLSR